MSSKKQKKVKQSKLKNTPPVESSTDSEEDDEVVKYNNFNENSDDSMDDEVLNRKGNVPLKWYEEFKHVGYDIEAKRVLKKKQDDKIAEFIKRSEDKNWWRTIHDELNNQDVILNDKQLDILERVRRGKFADKGIAENDYSVEYEWKEGMMPLSAAPIPKRAFLPSKWERIKVNKLVQAIKLGRITFDDDKNKKEEEPLWDLWENTTEEEKGILKRMPPAISAPKLKLPGHSESYNPSDEFLFDDDELKQWMDMDPEDRPTNFIPKKYPNLRKVLSYDNMIKERFERCLDLYLCPRVRRKKLSIDPESLIPNLPKPSELRPFPTLQNMKFKGHQSRVRCISVFHTGQFLASCDESGVLIIWDVITGRVVKRDDLEGINYWLDWSLDPRGGLLAVGNEERLILYNFEFLPNLCYQNNETNLEESKENHEKETKQLLKWNYIESDSEDYSKGKRVTVQVDGAIKFLTFHQKGDYVATVAPTATKQNELVLVHCISKGQTQRPFNKSKGNVQRVMFHPTKPYMFIVTKKNTYIYNIQKQAMIKKLVSGAQWNSCMAIHPKGDNIIVGSYDKRLCWFDLDLSHTPYKTLRYHQRAIRQVIFHNKYPLFASSSDDGTVHIFHATIYNDLMQNALIVPLKVLKGHTVKDDLGVLDIVFHPKQPWVFSCGADHQIILWT